MVVMEKTFHLVLIKPSHYDDDGYVIQWERSAIPSNSLAVLHALAVDSAQRKILGDDVSIEVEAYDETNIMIPTRKIIQRIRGGVGGMVGFVGVQTNQFPRALDVGKPFIQAGVSVVIGGFHVSGCFAMLDNSPPDIQQAISEGFTLVAGEAEGHLDGILKDAYEHKLKSVYNFLSDNPSLQGMPSPFLPVNVVKRTFRRMSSFDAGRGCPFQCSFCTIINVQGRTSRWRSPEDIEALIRANLKQGVWRFLISDDDFARNRGWEPILDRLIHMREREGLRISLAIQVDTLCHKIPRFVEKAFRAGCHNVFIGLENLNPSSLIGAKKRQNKIEEYRAMLQAWKSHGCTTVAGYIIGFPLDTPQSIAHDIEIVKRELPVDILEFFVLTPLPGSEDHQRLSQAGVWMDPDMNKYDLEHATMAHPRMSMKEWEHAYKMAWKAYYTWDHMETIMRRAAATSQPVEKVMFFLLCFYGCMMIEGLHPLEGGVFRRRRRRARRPDMPLENLWMFYFRRGRDFLLTSVRWCRLAWKLHRLRTRIENGLHKQAYVDVALSPATKTHEDHLDLFWTYGELIPIKGISGRTSMNVGPSSSPWSP
jgi:radical SAM superfamily enzyme YgiQ (UPF0313 family)